MGIRIDGASDLINATDGSLTIEGQSVNTTGIMTASGGIKVGSAATIHSTGQLNIGVAATIFASGNATFAGIVTASSFEGDGSALTGVAGTEISNSDFAVGVSTFFVDYSTGRIGIGTDVISDANVQLEVVSRTGKARLQFDNKPLVATNDAQIGGILFRNAADSVGYVLCNRESAADDAYIKFGTQAAGGSVAERLRITSAGNVDISTGNIGIGTTNANTERIAGAASSFVGLYINDGFIGFPTSLNRDGGYFIATTVNALNAGPVSLGATMTLHGTWTIV